MLQSADLLVCVIKYKRALTTGMLISWSISAGGRAFVLYIKKSKYSVTLAEEDLGWT